MYAYIYDSFVQDRKYEKNLAQLENRVTDLGINGHIHKLSILKNLREIVQDEIKAGTATIVIVGNDATVSQAVDVIAETDVALGIIPIGAKNSIAAVLGVTGQNAVEILSKRIMQKMDLGKVNDIYFLFSLQINSTNAIIESNGYKIAPRFDIYNIDIYNFIISAKGPLSSAKVRNGQFGDFSPQTFNPFDGVLEAIIYKAGKESLIKRIIGKKRLDISTFLPFKKIKIKKPLDGKDNKEIKALIDGQKIVKTPLTIEALPASLRMIVGKNRIFAKI